MLMRSEKNVERQQNMILETVGNHNDSRDIRADTAQVLEREDKIKAATLRVIIDTKVSISVRNNYSEVTLQMSKLTKKVMKLEKQPVEKDNVITINKEKISTSKVASDVK